MAPILFLKSTHIFGRNFGVCFEETNPDFYDYTDLSRMRASADYPTAKYGDGGSGLPNASGGSGGSSKLVTFLEKSEKSL